MQAKVDATSRFSRHEIIHIVEVLPVKFLVKEIPSACRVFDERLTGGMSKRESKSPFREALACRGLPRLEFDGEVIVLDDTPENSLKAMAG